MSKETKRLIIILSIGFFCAVLMVFMSMGLTFFEIMENRMIDFRFSIRDVNYEGLESSDVVIVAIDDQSYSALGLFPWPRTVHAKLVDNLYKAGAKTVLFDIEFTEEKTEDPQQDDIFANSIANAKNVVLSGKMIVQEREGFYLQSLLPPIEKLQEVAPYGIVDTYADADNHIRRYILYRDYEGERYFSIGLAAIINYLGLEGDHTDYFVELGTGDYLLGGQYFINVYDSLPSSFINYYGPAYSFKYISYEQVVDDEGFQLLLEKDVFKDKIVTIGASISELHDNFPTPFFVSGGRILTPGVEIHSNFIQSVLDQNFIATVPDYYVYLITLIFTIALAFIIKRTKPVIGITSAIGMAAVYSIVNVLLFARWQILMNFITPMSGIGLTVIGCIAYQYFSEEREKMRVRSVFKHYLAENVVDSVLEDTDTLRFGGEKKHLTVLFSDIRSFTTYSEKYLPEEVVAILGEYLTEMVDVIQKHEGMLDKFVGDEIMAVFGAPYYMDDHAEKACFTALEMIRKLDELKEKWQEQGREGFNIGIGVNTGDMIVGNLGSTQIFDYTVIGDAVNLGARLEGINKVYQTANNIIISEFTKDELSDKIVTRELDSVRVKGKKKPVAIFELVGEKDVVVYPEEFLGHFSAGLASYKKMEWERAIEEFSKGCKIKEDEVCNMYIKRCRHFKKNPPAEDWDGVFTLKTK
ncbi:MAG: adenylate/guanylate cyclase domain-containing protein [Spirochaetota bacterium]|nr:MAG: adenylate/guanylate cyclase domain-containing protein [Spirochaetota bacterium]